MEPILRNYWKLNKSEIAQEYFGGWDNKGGNNFKQIENTYNQLGGGTNLSTGS